MKRKRKLKRKARKQSTYLKKIRNSELRLIKPVPDAQTKKPFTGSQQHSANTLALGKNAQSNTSNAQDAPTYGTRAPRRLLYTCATDLQNHIKNPEYLTSLNALALSKLGQADLMIKTPSRLRHLLKGEGYSEEAVKEVWKWYDFSERKGVASF